MDDDIHDIDDLFYNALESKLQQPSEKVWERINAQLNEDNKKKPLAFIRPKRLQSLFFLLAVAVLGVNGYYLNKRTNVELSATTDSLNLEKINLTTITRNNTNVAIATKNDSVGHRPNTSADNVDDYKNHPILLRTGTNTNQVDNKPIFKTQEKKPPDFKAVPGKDWQNNTVLRKSIAPTTNNPNPKHDPDNSYINVGKVARNHNNSRENRTENIKNGQKENILNNNGSIVKNTSESDESYQFNNVIGNDIMVPIIQTAAMSVLRDTQKVGQLALLLPLDNQHPLKINPLKKSHSDLRTNTPDSRWYASLFAAQEWQGYQLQDNDGPRSPQNGFDDKNSIRHREDEDPSLAAGINIGFKLGKRISMETGIRFGGYHIRTDSAKIYAENIAGDVEYKLTTSSGYAYLKGAGGSLPLVGDSLTAQKVNQTIRYFGIPILLRYRMGTGRLSFDPAMGLVLNFISTSTASADLTGGQANELQRVNLHGLNRFSTVVIINPSVYFRFGRHVSIGLEPYFNYSISPINNTNVVKSYPYGLGLGTGIRYSF